MTYQRILITYLSGAVILSAPAEAHHSAAAVFTKDTIEIEGYVTEFNFRNPHVNVLLRVEDDSGAETLWMATGPAAPPFRRWGWSPDTIHVGQYLRISGRKSRDGAPMILMEGPDILGGKIAELDPADGSIIRIVEGAASDSSEATLVSSLPLRLSDGRPNLSGTWLGGPRGERTTPPFNERGAALQAAFDPINDPAFAACADPGLVRQAAFTPHPMRITQYDDRVLLEYEEHAGRRVIYLDGRAPETPRKTRFGHHVAHYDGDALVIVTTQLSANLSGPGGNALSDQHTTVETYRRADDPKLGAVLEMSMVVNDPKYLTGPWGVNWQKVYTADEYQFTPVDCRLPLSPIGDAAARRVPGE